MPKLTLEELVSLEALTGQQYNLNGTPRKKRRNIHETIKMGIVNAEVTRYYHEESLLDFVEEYGDLDDYDFEQQAVKSGYTPDDIEWMQAQINDEGDAAFNSMTRGHFVW